MRFYTKQHQFYCGVDLHADAMYACILNAVGEIVAHKNIPTKPKAFLRLIKPYREGLIIGCECMFTWYWLAGLCADADIDFVLGHALLHAGHSGKRIGNAHLRRAFGEDIILMLKGNKPKQQMVQKMANRNGKDKALAILSARPGRAVYDMLKNQGPFHQDLFLRT